MTEKCYDLKYLQKYENKAFIYERKSLYNENVYSYKTIIEETIKCLEYFNKYQVEKLVGVAVDFQEHSRATCVLILGILNHNCHFYCLDFEKLNDASNYIRLSGVKYLISTKVIKSDQISYDNVQQMSIFDNIFYLGTLKPSNTTVQNAKLCYTIATSGTTGQPKMVHVPYKCIQPNIKSLSALLNISENDVIFLGSPSTFDPFVVEFFIALDKGASILMTSNEIRLRPEELFKILFPEDLASMKGVTIFQTTPSLFRLFGKNSIQDILNSKTPLRCLILGGEEFPSVVELKNWLPLDISPSGKRIFNTYGVTEVSCWSSIYEVVCLKHLKEQGRVPLGEPLDNLTLFRLVDEDGNILQHNCCQGELEIGSSIRHCFIPQYDKDIGILESNDVIYRKTGDSVERDQFGNIYYIGRTNNIIKRLGKRLCLDTLTKKVEYLLNAQNLSYKVVCLWHKDINKLILYLVNHHTTNSAITTNGTKWPILYLLKQNLESYEQPDEIFYNDELPLNTHGKVDRKRILEKIFTMKQTQNCSQVEIFKKFLTNVMGFNMDCTKNNQSQLNVSFSEAGGTSFQALSLAMEITEVMEQPQDQRHILEMLMDNKVTIHKILEFLSSTATKTKNKTESHLIMANLNNISHRLKLIWRCDLKKCIDAAPTIYKDKFVAVGSHSHLLMTLDTKTGQQISCLELSDRIECPVVFVNTKLALVGCYDGFLYGFDFNNSSILWKLNVKGMIKARPLVVESRIIVASYADEFNIVVYDLKTLELKWNLKLGSKGIISSPLQISLETVLFCSLDGSYALIDIKCGAIKWQQKLDSPIFSNAAKIHTSSSEILLILAEVSGRILICNQENGEKITSFQAEGNIFSGLTACNQDTNNILIIFGCHDSNVYCLNFANTNRLLTVKWLFPLNSPVYSTPVLISKCYILVCSTKGVMALIDLVAGTLVAYYEMKAEVFSTPSTLKDKFIYVGSRDNYLYAIKVPPAFMLYASV